MKKGNTYEGIVETVHFPNKGIVLYKEEIEENGMTEIKQIPVIVKGTLPGQKVRFQISKKRKGKYEARLLEVIERSELENAFPKCPHFGICGGCTFQTMTYDNQLSLKSKQVKSMFDEVCDNYIYEGIIGSPIVWEYRNKMEFSFGDEEKDGPLSLGMHKKGSFYDIVTTDHCKIVNNDYNKILVLLLDYFKEKNVDFYHKMNHVGYVRHLLIRRAVKTGEMTINIVTSSQETDKEGNVISLDDITDRLLNLNLEGKIVGIVHIYNDSLADVVKSDKTEILYGQDYFYEEILGLKFKISTFSFFQTNSLGAEVLYEKVREYVGDTNGKVIFDLYSGTGTITQMLAKVADRAVGVEIVEEAVEAAKENAKLNGLNNCEFIAGDVLKVIDELREDKPDLIVLDPPRDGIHPKALQKIIDFDVDKMVYISCKPTSLVRDLIVLQERGYRVERMCMIDLFSWSVHVECVVLMSRKDG